MILEGIHHSRTLPTMDMSEWAKYYSGRGNVNPSGLDNYNPIAFLYPTRKRYQVVKILRTPEEANPHPSENYGKTPLRVLLREHPKR